MDPRQARALIANVTYKPTWFLSTTIESNMLVLKVDYVERNSNSEYAPNYPNRTYNSLEFEFTTAELDTPEQVYRKVLNCLLECEKHEATEFFKVGRSFDAIFHPHSDAGRALLEQTDEVAHPTSL